MNVRFRGNYLYPGPSAPDGTEILPGPPHPRRPDFSALTPEKCVVLPLFIIPEPFYYFNRE